MHRDRRPDLNSKRRPFTLFCSCVFVCLSRGKVVAARHPALACSSRRGNSAGSPRVRWPRALMPANRGRSRHRPASDSMPAGSPLTHARRIAADSCPLAAAYPSPMESPHVTARSAVCLFCCAHRNILIKSCLVMSVETRLGQAAPLVVAMEAILDAWPLVADMEAVAEGPCEGL